MRAGALRCSAGAGDANVPCPLEVARDGSERLKWNFFTGVKQRPIVKAWCHFGAFGVFTADKQVRTVLHLSIAQGPFARAISARGGLQQRSGLVFPGALPSLFCSGVSCLGEAGSARGVMPAAAKSTLVLEGLRVAKDGQVVKYPHRLNKLPTCKILMNFIPCQLSSLKQLAPRQV